MSRMKLIVELDPREMAVLMLEGLSGKPRPEGLTAEQALNGFDDGHRRLYLRTAESLIAYVVAQTSGERPS